MSGQMHAQAVQSWRVFGCQHCVRPLHTPVLGRLPVDGRLDKEEIKHPSSAFLKISTSAHLAHLQSPSSQPATQALQKSQIFRHSRNPIFTSFLINWRFFDFQYSPEIEAKDNKHSVKGGIQQALGYSNTLDIPCVFSSNGDGFYFHDK